MSCISNDSEEYSAFLGYVNRNSSAEADVYVRLEKLLLNHVVVGICGFGTVGNVLNLMALASIVINKPMDRMERSATVGLLALAVSDLLFCVAVLPYYIYDFEKVLYESRSFLLTFHLYNGAIISTLVTTSTWLTVVMALSRYLAICRPLEARVIIGMTFAKASIFTAFVFSFLLNLPKFLHLTYVCLVPPSGDEEEVKPEVYMTIQGFLQKNKTLGRVYYTSYLVIGILGPLIVLAYCNFFLIRALRKSSRMRRQLQADSDSCRTNNCTLDAYPSTNGEASKSKRGQINVGQKKNRVQETSGRHKADTSNTITLTLTIIVVMYLVLVLPAETSNIFTSMVESDSQPIFSFAVTVANTLQTINFSFNFVLYCVINVHFRRMIHAIITCQAWRCKRSRRYGSPQESGSDATETFVTSATGTRKCFSASPRLGMNNANVRYTSFPASPRLGMNNANVRYTSCPAGDGKDRPTAKHVIADEIDERFVVADQHKGQDVTISFNCPIDNARYN